MERPITRKEMIQNIFLFASVTPSFKKLANMPLDNLRALYTWLFYGESEEIREEGF